MPSRETNAVPASIAKKAGRTSAKQKSAQIDAAIDDWLAAIRGPRATEVRSVGGVRPPLLARRRRPKPAQSGAA